MFIKIAIGAMSPRYHFLFLFWGEHINFQVRKRSLVNENSSDNSYNDKTELVW